MNTLSALLAVVLPAIASHAFAQACNNQTLTSASSSGCAANVSSGSVVSGTTVNAGGKQTVSAGGSTIATIINNSGSQNLVGGVATSTTINSGGKQTISAGGSAFSTMIMSGGSQVVSSGGVATSAVIGGGIQAVTSGGVANGTIINAGVQTVSAGATANGAVVNSGGTQSVSGGVASGTIVNSGGSASVTSGGTSLNAVVSSFAKQTVQSKGVAVNTVLVGAVSSGGTQYISAGGSSLNTSVGQKARQTVYAGGVANATAVLSAGTQTVSSGGQSLATTVASGGMQSVMGGGTATGTSVAAGATATLYVGGTTASGTLAAPVFTSGNVQGTLVLATTSSVAVTGNPVATANALTINGGSVVFDAPDAAGYKTFTINGLSGSGTFTLNTQIASGQADLLVVNNGSGNYTLNLSDTSTTTAKGVKMQLVGGTNDNATFVLANGSFDVGAEKYGLEDVGGQYYLYDTGQLGNAASVAQAMPGVSTMLWYQQLQQTASRLAELRGGTDQGLWIRAYGERFTLDSAGVSSTVDAGGVQFGRDLRFARSYGDWYAGLTGGVAQARTNVGDSGSASAYPFNAGLYGGLAAKNGWFANATAGYVGTSNTLNITGNNSGEYHDNGFSATLEAGRRFVMPGNWTIEPKAGVDYIRSNSVSYALQTGMPVQLAAHGATIATAGATISKPVAFWHATLQPYFTLDAMHAFNNQQTVTVAGTPISAQTPGSWAMVAAGISGSLNKRSHLYLDVSYAKGDHYQSPLAINVGFSYQK